VDLSGDWGAGAFASGGGVGGSGLPPVPMMPMGTGTKVRWCTPTPGLPQVDPRLTPG